MDEGQSISNGGSPAPPSRPTSSFGFRRRKGRSNDEGPDDSSGGREGIFQIPPVAVPPTTSLLPPFASLTIRIFFGTTVALYILNQKHLLSKPLSSFVSRALFWPTLPITFSRRIGKWITEIDETVVMGGAPFGFAGLPDRLHDDYGVKGVINMCDEYSGPTKQYERLGIEELWLRTVDHFEPSFESLKEAVSFIQRYEKEGRGRVYIHCRAGHGRSAAVSYVWLLSKNPKADPLQLNIHLRSLRNVRGTLWKQENVQRYRKWLLKLEGGVDDGENVDEKSDREKKGSEGAVMAEYQLDNQT